MKIDSSPDFLSYSTGLDNVSNLKPLRKAITVTLVYTAVISLYIFVSGNIAAGISTTAEDLARIEFIKGLVFALTTGIMLFIAAYFVFRKIAAQNDLIISRSKSIISTERLVMAGLFSSSVCHDINNIMLIIKCNVDFLYESENLNEADKGYVSEITKASDRLITLVARMMDAGKGYIPGEKSYENISYHVIDTIEFAKIHRKIKARRIQHEIQPGLHMHINPILLSRALMNLILNSADATNKSGNILIRLFQKENFIMLEVHDDGPGVPEEMQEKIFEPFYTSKKEGNGLGLLSLKICSHQHDAEISITKSHLGGACFSLAFPIKDDEK